MIAGEKIKFSYGDYLKKKGIFMNSDFKKGIHLFYKEIEKVVEGEEKQKYLKVKFLQFIEENIARFEEEIERREEKLKELEKKSEMMESAMKEIRSKISYIENDFYGEDEKENFEITCPYCNYEFEAEIEDEIGEIRCPECENIIELDWGDYSDDQEGNNGCCGGGCSHCGNC